METLHLLTVAVPSQVRESLTQSLTRTQYPFEIIEAADKRQALAACSHLKFDVLIVSPRLPEVPAEDLVKVLNGSVACLILDSGYPPTDWVKTLALALDDWKGKVEGKTRQHLQYQQLRHATALERCVQELRYISEEAIDRVLKVALDVMEVSRVYIRETPLGQTGPPVVTHEVAAPGHLPLLGSQRSAYEVSVQRADGRVFHLGIEDVTHQRSWSQSETDLIQAVAQLLKENSGGNSGVRNANFGFRLSA